MKIIPAMEPAKNDDQKTLHKNKIFRFEFSEDIIELIKRFSLVHQYDERKVYKERWNNWFQEHKEIMEREMHRMIDLGYEGDVHDKMFKAGRYYFRKKNIKKDKEEKKEKEEKEDKEDKKEKEDNEDKEGRDANTSNANTMDLKKKNDEKTPQKKRNYISMLQTTLDAMDKHLKEQLETNDNFSPASGFNNFCANFTTIIRTEVNRMVTENEMKTTEISDKIKKTYKNRYYMITRN